MIKVLDHGYVELIETWGSDERIIESARMSTNKGFQGWGPRHTNACMKSMISVNPDTGKFDHECSCDFNSPGDEKLLRYLYEHKHMTPFEMAGMTIEVQAPIFVFREWHRHRTQSYNEMSARYTPMPDVNYVPSLERVMQTGGTNKQSIGLDGKALDDYNASVWRQELQDLYTRAQEIYNMGLELGVPKELARLVLPVGRYSRMRASANLRNWLAFLTLRMDPAAQWEIRQYANTLHNQLAVLFPRVMTLFDEGQKDE